MFTIAWWYMLATYAAIWMGLLVDPVWFYGAIGLCALQAFHFGIEDKSFFSFTCQVRYAFLLILSIGLFEGMGWIYWIPIVGLTARLTVNYCLLARLVSLLPWNSQQPFSWPLFKKTVLSKPVDGCILKVKPA